MTRRAGLKLSRVSLRDASTFSGGVVLSKRAQEVPQDSGQIVIQNSFRLVLYSEKINILKYIFFKVNLTYTSAKKKGTLNAFEPMSTLTKNGKRDRERVSKN